MARIFHYTIRELLDRILVDGAIKVATAHLPAGVRAAVWCSFHPLWVSTANKAIATSDGSLIALDMQGTHEYSRGLTRIEIDPTSARYDWDDYKCLSGDSRRMLKSLYDTAIQCGDSPRSWRCSFEAIPQDKWLAIEYWSGEVWPSQPFENERVRVVPATPQTGRCGLGAA